MARMKKGRQIWIKKTHSDIRNVLKLSVKIGKKTHLNSALIITYITYAAHFLFFTCNRGRGWASGNGGRKPSTYTHVHIYKYIYILAMAATSSSAAAESSSSGMAWCRVTSEALLQEHLAQHESDNNRDDYINNERGLGDDADGGRGGGGRGGSGG